MRKKLSIALLAFSLALICANFLAKRVHNVLRPPVQEEENTFFPFSLGKTGQDNNFIEIKDADNKEKPSYIIIKDEEENFQKPKEIIQPILKVELSEEEKQTIENYAQNEKLRAFITDLSGVISQDELNQENYLKIAFKPEVRAIFMQYAQDPEFREIATTVMKDKNVLELAKKVIQNKEVAK